MNNPLILSVFLLILCSGSSQAGSVENCYSSGDTSYCITQSDDGNSSLKNCINNDDGSSSCVTQDGN